MKKAVLLSAFCIISIFQHIEAVEVFYRSNSLGMVFEEADSINNTDSEYYVGVETGGGMEKKRLYSTEEKEFVKTWETYYFYDGTVHFELEYSYKELKTKRIYLNTGVVSEEIDFGVNETINSHIYFTYNSSRQLSSVTAYNGEEELLYKEHYSYAQSGMLRELIHENDEGDFNIYSYNFGNGVLIEEIAKEGEYLYISRFSSDGKLLINEIWKNNDIITRAERKYDSSSGRLKEIIEENFILNTRIVKSYNEEGRLIDELSEAQGQKKYFHDEEGRVIRIRNNTPSGVEQWDYEYDEEDEVTKETYSFQGSIIKVIIYTGENTRYEEIYRQGKPFLRVYYEKEEKIREELIRGVQQE